MPTPAREKLMTRATEAAGYADLEEEFELDMEEAIDDRSGELDEEFESDDDEFESEFESYPDETGEYELDDAEFEDEYGNDYASRLMELSLREFESEFELEAGLNEVFDDMQTEYFLGGLKKWAKKGLSAGARSLISRVKKAASGLPMGQALKGLLASRSLTDLLKNVAKTGISTALKSHPGLAAISAIGGGLLKQGEFRTGDREQFEQVVSLSREAYEHLARNLNEASNNPVGASQQVADAIKAGMERVQPRRGGAARTRGGRGRKRVIRLRPNQKLVIIG
jgi:hypothetical protein